MVLAQKEAEGLCGLLSALDGLGQVISNLLQCSHLHNGDNSNHATAELARHSVWSLIKVWEVAEDVQPAQTTVSSSLSLF